MQLPMIYNYDIELNVWLTKLMKKEMACKRACNNFVKIQSNRCWSCIFFDNESIYSLDEPYWYPCLLISLKMLYYIYVEMVQALITIAFSTEASTLDLSGNLEEQLHHFNDSWCWQFVHFLKILFNQLNAEKVNTCI